MVTPAPPIPDAASATRGWLNRTTLGISLASLFSDISHELATAVLPAFLVSLGAGPAALGWIEGSADGLSAVAKLWGGVAADRVRRRKPLASVGYLVTAVGTAGIGLCTAAWQVLFCRVAAWIGRGSRSPARDVLMAEGAPKEAHGRAFGMERAGDAAGAVMGPLLAMLLLARGMEPRHLMLVSLLPGSLAFLSIAWLVAERTHVPRRDSFSLRAELAGTGRPFRRYLVGILVFGAGDFSRTLLILYATQHITGTLFSLRGAAAAVALYVLHNAVSAGAALPIGAFADRVGHRRVIVGGYVLAAVTTMAFALAPPTPYWLLLLFVCSGVYIASEEVAEKSYAATLLPADRRGAGMGLLAAANGVGDTVSSALVGSLWALAPDAAWGFGAAAALQALGALMIAFMAHAPTRPARPS
ncbi:MAG TPA: MFS transporter [Vicinamibacteria bacterium]|nr:MFS transporter [Vicinamibacteria bacterium]